MMAARHEEATEAAQRAQTIPAAQNAPDVISDALDTEAVSAFYDPWLAGALAVWPRRTGSARRPRAELAEPYQLLLKGNGEKAAQLWTDLGCPYEAAL